MVTFSVEAPTRLVAAVAPVRRADSTPVNVVGDCEMVPEPLAVLMRICVALSAI